MASSTPESALLLSLGLAIFAALAFSLLFSKIKQPVVIGQLVAGIIIGPFGLGLIQDLTIINLLASLGIILLLFVVGLELDLKEIRRIGRESILLVIIELTVSFVSVFLVALVVGLGYIEAVFAGILVSTTSTAIMGKILLETHSLKAREQHLVLTASVMEDFATVFILLLLPGLVLADNQLPLTDFGLLALKALLLLGLIFGFGWKLAPRIIDRVSKSDQEYKETAFLLALSFGFIFALLSSYLGFSPAIGAFLMGLMISGKQAKFILEKIGPVKDLFVVLFFVSMGTLINVGSLVSLTFPILAVLATAIAGKFFGCWLGTRFFISKREANKVGISMLPRGEFSFIVAREGVGTGVAFQWLYPLAGLTTLLSSIIASVGLRLSRTIRKINPPIVAPAPVRPGSHHHGTMRK